jgi:hypothetical protein
MVLQPQGGGLVCIIASTIDHQLRSVLTKAGDDFVSFRGKVGCRLSTKLQSEIISALIENSFASTIGARCGTTDAQADLYINDIPLELKTSHHSREWRGGEFSKRSGHFLLISWKLNSDHNKMEWFVLHTILSEEDWRTSKSKNYYATSITIDDALLKSGRVIIGHTKTAKTRMHPVHEML